MQTQMQSQSACLAEQKWQSETGCRTTAKPPDSIACWLQQWWLVMRASPAGGTGCRTHDVHEESPCLQPCRQVVDASTNRLRRFTFHHLQRLPSASSARYLGVHLDNRLDWDTHVNYVVTKVAKKIGALWWARRSLSRRRSRQVYVKAVIMRDLLYGSFCLSATMREGQLKRLQTAQNRAIRCVEGNPPRTAMQPLLTAHSLYRVSELYRQKILITIWRCIHARTSPVLAQLLTQAQGTPTRHQQSNGLLSQANRSRRGQRRFSVAGALLWNALPGEVRGTSTWLPEFKHACVPYACRE